MPTIELHQRKCAEAARQDGTSEKRKLGYVLLLFTSSDVRTRPMRSIQLQWWGSSSVRHVGCVLRDFDAM
jgi:hypothetical protein